jgi:hypothetical protein
MTMHSAHQTESGLRQETARAGGMGIDASAQPHPTRSPTGTASPLSSELAALATTRYADLHQMWRRYYRAVPPKKISRDILELGIAWKMQEGRLGGLSSRDKRQVSELSRAMEQKAGLSKPRTVAPKTGSRLLRTWGGMTHEVIVVNDGFVWSGKTWASLSVIAREITGTRWSGPRFFGLTSAGNKPPGAGTSEETDHE